MARQKQPVPCDDCGKEFKYKYAVSKHKMRMHKEKYKDLLEKCDICNFYAEHNALNAHIIRKHKENSIVCQLCNSTFTFKTDLKRHEMTKHNENYERQLGKKINCEDCGESFVDKNVFKHKLTVHGEKYKQFLVKCDICAYETYGKAGLDIHNKRKHQEKSVLCKICNKAFAMKPDLEIHHINKHTDARPFQCQQCPSSFKRSCNLLFHERSVHSDSKKYQCDVCSKSFKYPSSMRRCLENHEKGNQKVPCPLPGCEVTVKNPSLIRPHLRYHEQKKVKEHTCSICFKAFGAKTNLSHHIKNVHIKPEKKFQCTKCPTKCSSLNKLDSHSKIHEGKVFPCTVNGCSSKSNTQYGINFHIKKKHGVISRRDYFVPIEKRPFQTCKICGAVLAPSLSPLHTMKLHMKSHENKLHIACPVADCNARIKEFDKVTYKPPEIWFKHLWNEHAISQEYIEARYDCKKCVYQVKINFGVVNRDKLKDILKKHLTSVHKDILSLKFIWSDQWNEFYSREMEVVKHFQGDSKVQIDKSSVQDTINQKRKKTCSICGKLFIYEGYLNKHLEWHEEIGDIEVKTDSKGKIDNNNENNSEIVDMTEKITDSLDLQIQNSINKEHINEDKVQEILDKIPNHKNESILENNDMSSINSEWYLED